LDESRAVRREANVEGVDSQKRIESVSDETERLFARYSTALRQIDSLRVYNRQMRELADSQARELDSLDAQLDRVEEVGRSVTPLMLRMIAALEAFVKLDIPFLIDERTERAQGLRDLMKRADVTNAEKYRQIMEAYQIENEFGRTIEAYRSTLERDGKEFTADFLRFGRIALVEPGDALVGSPRFQVPHGHSTGVANRAQAGGAGSDPATAARSRDRGKR
jgi:hypothetical protein